MEKIQKIKGFPDIFPPLSQAYAHMEATAKDVFGRYGYAEVRTPILERTELFARSIGEETDVVQKEMYTFPDRKGRSLTLRPEATAGILRAYIESGLAGQDEQAKLFSIGPMFRYERPQKGRMRQFHQIDVEALGSGSAFLDAEIILMLAHFFRELGVANLAIELNSLGCPTCRPAYLDALNEAFRGFDSGSLCEDCLRRKLTNPLRLLDCKVPSCRELTRSAPNIIDHLCPECAEHFAAVRSVLDAQGVAYRLNPRLVRGLDYYVRTTFEVVSTDIGAQSAVAGGGRYDGLIRNLGGPDLPGVGFAIGMERVAMLLGANTAQAPDFFLAVLGGNLLDEGLRLAQELRLAGLAGECALAPRSVKSQLRQADRSGARFCLILGADELAGGVVQVKDMRRGGQESVARRDLADSLRNNDKQQ